MVYETASGEAVATVHGGEKAFRRSLPLQRAPALLGVVRTAAGVFALMSESGKEFERSVALDLLPLMQAALYLLDEEADSPG